MNPCGGYYYGSGYSNCNTGDIIIPPVVIVPPINQNTCQTPTSCPPTSCQTSCPQTDCCWGGMGMGMCNPMMGMYPMIGSMGMPTYPMQPPMIPGMPIPGMPMPGMPMPGMPPMSPPPGGSMGYYY